MLRELKKLYQANLLAPVGLYKLVTSFLHSGINLMALMRFSARRMPHGIAVVDENERVTYKELYLQTEQLAAALQKNYKVDGKQKVALVCRNHAALIRSIFALSKLGADIYLLNIEMSGSQFATLLQQQHFDLIIHDDEVTVAIEASGFTRPCVFSCHATAPSVDAMSKTQGNHGRKVRHNARAGNLVVLSGGTTGNHKAAARRQGIMSYVSPLCSLLVQADLAARRSVYIATPVYHGYGLAAVFVSVLLGTEIYLLPRFDAINACELIKHNKIEAATLVPIMLHRMLAHDDASLHSLQTIISGGAPISPVLVQQTIDKLGPKLYNLYGTSEAGLSVLATPSDLQHAPSTIGRELPGVDLKILDAHNNELAQGATGRICIRNKWSVTRAAKTWIETGDLGYKDTSGYCYLCGRTDDMIISGGENVYPITLEHVLLQHPDIGEAAVVGISDAEFGQRLKAFVVPTPGSALQAEEIYRWLTGKVARFQVPREIEVMPELPYTQVGKPDKRALARTTVVST